MRARPHTHALGKGGREAGRLDLGVTIRDCNPPHCNTTPGAGAGSQTADLVHIAPGLLVHTHISRDDVNNIQIGFQIIDIRAKDREVPSEPEYLNVGKPVYQWLAGGGNYRGSTVGGVADVIARS